MDKLASLKEIDIKKELKIISDLGFIKSKRKNNTGIGYTLETLLGIKENNDAEPDFLFESSPVELKTQRNHTSSNITLFTLEPPRGTKKDYKDMNLLKKFGYVAEGRTNLYVSMKKNKPNPQGFKIELKDDCLIITNTKKGEIWKYPLEYIFAKLKKKLSHKLLVVTADAKETEEGEFFHYKEGIMYSEMTYEGFVDLVKSNALVVEFRMHIGSKNNKAFARNHGTAFRLNLRHIDKLFSKKEKIL